jgi:hypothetical protein
MNKHNPLKTLAENRFGSTPTTPEKRFPTSRQAVCSLLDSAHSLDRAARALKTFTIAEEPELVALQRLRDRVDDIARLVSETTESLKLLGVGKNDPLIEIDGQLIGLQEASRRIRKVQLDLAEYTAREQGTRSGPDSSATPLAAPPDRPPPVILGTIALVGGIVLGIIALISAIFAALYGVVTLGKELGEKIAALFNATDDDRARERIFAASEEEIRGMSDNELVSMLNAMLDGPTGDDDETAILKVLEAFDCEGRIRIVNRVGVNELLDNVDGEEWDRLVSLLADCGIIGIDQLDDDGSRVFVKNHSCAQLGQLSMSSVRQLVLNMFSGACGDDDEDAILKLVRCQSKARLQQLVTMPRMSVEDFDDNVDGDQWDDLEAHFNANGIPT